jgi:hypothetical protein
LASKSNGASPGGVVTSGGDANDVVVEGEENEGGKIVGRWRVVRFLEAGIVSWETFFFFFFFCIEVWDIMTAPTFEHQRKPIEIIAAWSDPEESFSSIGELASLTILQS